MSCGILLREFNTGDQEFPSHFVLRDTTYERLCSLAKAAHRSDRELNPGSHDWEFAFDVSRLNRHPMCWLLQWAGVKQRRPWWALWLLIISALLFILSTVLLMLLVINKPWASWRWAAVLAGYVSVVLLVRLASRRIEERQLERRIENGETLLALLAVWHDDCRNVAVTLKAPQNV